MSEPVHVTIARKYIGTREIVGPQNSSVIMGWIKRLGARVLGTVVTDDETAWCGTFMAEVMTEAGYATAPIAVRATSWASYGTSTPAYLGSIGVKQRVGGGHVFLIVGRTADGKFYKALGGNQGNMVCIEDVAVADVIATRWPTGAKGYGTMLPTMPAGKITSEA